jgi:hypothetical protein
VPGVTTYYKSMGKILIPQISPEFIDGILQYLKESPGNQLVPCVKLLDHHYWDEVNLQYHMKPNKLFFYPHKGLVNV